MCVLFYSYLQLNEVKQCTKCKKNQSVYFRPYSGEYLCKKCFIYSIEFKMAKTISKYSMINYDDKVGIGVSGGKDSLSLLCAIKRMYEAKGKNSKSLVAITIDEGINNYRNESLQIVKNYCEKLEIHNFVFSYKDLFDLTMDEAMQTRHNEKITSCSVCGTFRRRAIDIAAERLGVNILATAHNLDDQLQSFMINLFSGDVDRIGWIHPEPVQYGNFGIKKIKPFIEIYEQEIVFYALMQDIPFQSEECPYSNESIRTDIRSFLNSLETNRFGIKYNIYNSIIKISSRLKNTNSVSKKKCSKCGKDSSGEICSVCKTISLFHE